MRISLATSLLLLLSPLVTSRFVPRSDIALDDGGAISILDGSELLDFEKRRGGGGGGRGGSGGGSGGRSGSGSGSTGSGSSDSGGSGARGGSGSSSSSSNAGGVSKAGSGSPRTYGSGSYYAGGASVPYTAGARSPLGITPFLLPVAALAFFPGLWLYGAYAYPFGHPYYFHNPTTGANESLPVTCLCQEYSVCGCDENNNSTYLNSVFGNNPTNSSMVQVATVNGTKGIFVNGTLANGTTAADPSLSIAPVITAMSWSGYFVTVAVVSTAVWLL